MSPPHRPPDVNYVHYVRNLNELERRFPKQFDCKHIGRSWPDGWHTLVVRVFQYVDRSDHDVRWEQIKSKYGGLRMYAHCLPPRWDIAHPGGLYSSEDKSEGIQNQRLQRLLRAAERLSLRTCEICGGAAEQKMISQWISTVCPSCEPRLRKCYT